jgi:hypothetical protein
VFSAPLNELKNEIVNFSPYFHDENYRFIDADSFLHHRMLNIYETPSLPELYATISYVWLGLTASPIQLEQDGSFSVFCGHRSDGTLRENGGPISFNVLMYACTWASQSSCTYLWIDRLCILQTSKQDKAWQINRMYDLYNDCKECIVLPGGLQRLSSVYEETYWADRAWTYQEAILTWDHAVVLTKNWHRPREEQHWLVDGECHWQYLHQLFLEGGSLLTRSEEGTSSEGQPRLLLGRNAKALDVLRRIVEYKAWNYLAEEGEEVVSDRAIGQLVLQGVAMRASSRAVDMVLSILGLMGIQDHPQHQVPIAEFEENERFRATLSLVEATLRKDNEPEPPDASGNALLDIPLWWSVEMAPSGEGLQISPGHKSIQDDVAKLPSLHDLTKLLDQNDPEVILSHHPDTSIKRAPLSAWTFSVEQVEDSPVEKASSILADLSPDDLLAAYHAERSRVLVYHHEEGIIELCRNLELVHSEKDSEVDNFVVLGWSLKLVGHPYIRFFKFDVSHLFVH